MREKLFKELVVLGVMIGGLAIFNWVLLLSLHDFSYYYTWEGVKLASIVIGAEGLITCPLGIRQIEKIDKLWTDIMEVENWKKGR